MAGYPRLAGIPPSRCAARLPGKRRGPGPDTAHPGASGVRPLCRRLGEASRAACAARSGAARLGSGRGGGRSAWYRHSSATRVLKPSAPANAQPTCIRCFLRWSPMIFRQQPARTRGPAAKRTRLSEESALAVSEPRVTATIVGTLTSLHATVLIISRCAWRVTRCRRAPGQDKFGNR